MLTAHTIKTLRSLDKKKFRQKYNLFLVEGNKNINELNGSSYTIRDIYSSNAETLRLDGVEITPITERELKKISFLKSPKDSVAVCELKESSIDNSVSKNLLLDGIQDPGNLGTIIRLADWFGIQQVICSIDSADFYNPKVIQSSMGSFARVEVVYTNLSQFISHSANTTIGTAMDGQNMYEVDFPSKWNLVLGNEGKGIRKETFDHIKQTVAIPQFGKQMSTESLNVAMSVGIILGQIFNKKTYK